MLGDIVKKDRGNSSRLRVGCQGKLLENDGRL